MHALQIPVKLFQTFCWFGLFYIYQGVCFSSKLERAAGDEAKCLNETWLYLLWTSDFGPCLTNSLASRMVMCLLPAQHYVISEDGVNLTVQAVTHAITESWNLLSHDGLPVHDLASRGGDQVLML